MRQKSNLKSIALKARGLVMRCYVLTQICLRFFKSFLRHTNSFGPLFLGYRRFQDNGR